jgi:hypothetical protein
VKLTPTTYTWIVDPWERALSTFAQQFATMLIVAGSASLLLRQSWLLALDSAGFAGIIALLMAYVGALTALNEASATWDLIRRVVLTGVQSFLGIMTASVVAPSVIHAPWLGALGAAVIAMLTAFIKGVGPASNIRTRGASPIRAEAFGLAA